MSTDRDAEWLLGAGYGCGSSLSRADLLVYQKKTGGELEMSHRRIPNPSARFA
jgi:hypothetical protein